MIIVQARIPVLGDKRNVAYQHIHEFVDRVRTEQGCLSCEALVTLENPDVIVIHQAWRDAADLNEHAGGPHLDAFLDALPQFVDGEVSTLRYEALAAEEQGDLDLDLDDEPAGVPQGVTLH